MANDRIRYKAQSIRQGYEGKRIRRKRRLCWININNYNALEVVVVAAANDDDVVLLLLVHMFV